MSESNELRKNIRLAVQNAEIACQNEQKTRSRVDGAERVLTGFLLMPFWGRLKWLLFGWKLEKPKHKPEPTPIDPPSLPDAPDVLH